MIDDSDETDNLDVVTVDVIAMAPVILECLNAECNLGVGSALWLKMLLKWPKTPKLKIWKISNVKVVLDT